MPQQSSSSLRLGAAAFLLALASATQAAAPAPELLKVGDYRVEVASSGDGPYTVILESGFGRDLKVWRRVAPELAGSNKVVAYSRAGHGGSDPRPGTPGVASRTTELEQMIAAAGLRPPFILVGHSYGAFLIRSFAARNPGQVAGMVFVDPSHERFDFELRKLDPVQAERDKRVIEKMMPPSMQPELRAVQAIMDTGILPGAEPLPDVPAVVLTSIQHRERPELFLETPAAVQVWRKLHERFFEQFRSGSHVVTPDSGHNIHLEQPQLVVAAVEQVIAAAEARRLRAKESAAKLALLPAKAAR